MEEIVSVLVPILAGGGVASAIVSSLLSFRRRRDLKPHESRVSIQVEQADGTQTTAVVTGVDDHQAEELIRDIEEHAVKQA